MHSPLTVAFRIPRPWPEKSSTLGWYWPAMITIWHRDPEKGGDDDSCDYLGFDLTKKNGWWPGHLDEFKELSEDAQSAVRFVWWKWKDKLTARHWWQHPKFHLHHWEVQIHVLQALKRYLFSRCSRCGGRFSWKEATRGQVIGTWHGNGPAWFKNAEKIWHFKCDPTSKPNVPLEADMPATAREMAGRPVANA